MAFIGILLLGLVVIAISLAIIGLVLFLLGIGITAIIGSAILATTGKPLNQSKRKKLLVIVLLVAAALALVPSGYVIYQFVVGFVMN